MTFISSIFRNTSFPSPLPISTLPPASWWNPQNGTLPKFATYSITQDDINSYKNFLAQLPSTHLVIDTTMLLPTNTSGAVNHITAVGATLGWSGAVEAVEIGNECDLFSSNGFRNSTYDYTDYAHDFQNYLSALISQANLPPGKIQGATWCCGRFDASVDTYIDTFYGNLSTFSYHRYPLSHCDGNDVTLDELLEDAATVGQADRVAPWAAVSVGNQV